MFLGSREQNESNLAKLNDAKWKEIQCVILRTHGTRLKTRTILPYGLAN